MAFNTPNDLQYTETDEWVQIEGDEATIGITDFAQDQLGDIVYVELKDVGDLLETDVPFGAVESVKAASDLNMPVAGEIIAVNSEVIEKPELINQNPYGAWLIKIRIAPGTVGALLSAEKYIESTDQRGH